MTIRESWVMLRKYHVVGHVSLWAHHKSLRSWWTVQDQQGLQYRYITQESGQCYWNCWNYRRFFLRNWLAGRIEPAVIYREIHLLRLLQQTLLSIKTVRRWADKYTKGKTWCLLEWEYVQDIPRDFVWEQRRGIVSRKITPGRRVHRGIVVSWLRNNYPTWSDLVGYKKISGPSLMRKRKRHSGTRNFIWL